MQHWLTFGYLKDLQMFDKKQIQNIRNTFFKVKSSKERSQIAWLAQTLSEEEDDGPKRDAIYWSTLWFCSLPENRDEFRTMFNELTAGGSMLSLEDGLGEEPEDVVPTNTEGEELAQ